MAVDLTKSLEKLTMPVCPILFRQDWDKYPRAIPDWETPNRSFVIMAQKYEKMGVKNYLWPLALMDDGLRGVDPFQEKGLTETDITRITMEATFNPWYYLRELASPPPRAGGRESIQANRGILAMWWLYFNHITTITTQPRQTGKSMGAEGAVTYVTKVKGRRYPTVILTRNDDLRTETMRRIKLCAEALPKYLVGNMAREPWNSIEIHDSRWHNTVRCIIGSDSYQQAYNNARGIGCGTMLIDEPPYQKQIEASMSSALPSLTAVQEIAMRNNQPAGQLYTTTAGDPSTESGKYFWKFISDSTLFSESMMDCVNRQALEEFVRAGNPGVLSRDGKTRRGHLRVYALFTHTQLGKNDEWLMDMQSQSNQNDDDFDRDYRCLWKVGGVKSALSLKQHALLRSGIDTDPDVDVKFAEFAMNWYGGEADCRLKLLNQSTVWGLDTSDAQGRDAVALTILDPYTGEVIARGDSNHMSLDSFVTWLAQQLVVYKKAVLVPERKSSFATMMDTLARILIAHGEDPFARVYNTIVSDMGKYDQHQEQLMRGGASNDRGLYITFKRHFGFATASSGIHARDQLYGSFLNKAVNENGHQAKDTTLVSQLLQLVRDAKGRINHPEGGHDDAVVSWLLGHWFIRNALNLHHYGINARMILQACEGSDIDDERRIQQLEQAQLNQEIEEAVEQARLCNLPIKRKQLLERAKALRSMLDAKSGELQSIDARISEIEQEAKDSRGSYLTRTPDVREPTPGYGLGLFMP